LAGLDVLKVIRFTRVPNAVAIPLALSPSFKETAFTRSILHLNQDSEMYEVCPLNPA